MFIISKVKMLIIAIVRILSQWDKDISSPLYTVNTTKYMKRKVKYKNFDRILTVALLGDYSQNVPKPKRTQVKMYLRGDKIYSSEIKTYPSGVKTYPVCSQNVPMIFVLLQFVYKLIEIMYSSS